MTTNDVDAVVAASPDTSRCDDCHGLFPSDELTEIEYGGGETDEALQVCDGCLGEYAECYSCGRWFMARKLSEPSEEMLAGLYDEATVAVLLEDGGAPELVCSECEDEFDSHGPNADAR